MSKMTKPENDVTSRQHSPFRLLCEDAELYEIFGALDLITILSLSKPPLRTTSHVSKVRNSR